MAQKGDCYISVVIHGFVNPFFNHLGFAHLFEAEGHGEHTDSDDAVHDVHDQTRVGRGHFERVANKSSFDKKISQNT